MHVEIYGPNGTIKNCGTSPWGRGKRPHVHLDEP
jgi:hypothetical protein